MQEALGMVKTKGLVASMEAVDAMIKVEISYLQGSIASDRILQRRINIYKKEVAYIIWATSYI